MSHSFLDKWKKNNLNILHRMYPEVDKKDIKKYLDDVVKKNLQNPKCKLDNNYVGAVVNTNLLEVWDWIVAW